MRVLCRSGPPVPDLVKAIARAHCLLLVWRRRINVMNWIPQFLNWQTAAIAAGIAVPALLVVYFLTLPRRGLAVSSTLLWRKAIQDLQVNAPFQKLRRNLLLFLQLLLLALLCLALARPVANYQPGAGKMTVILIDRSASMATTDPELNGKTRL